MSEVTRRDFLKKSAAAGLSLSGLISACAKIDDQKPEETPTKSPEPTSTTEKKSPILELYHSPHKNLILEGAKTFIDVDVSEASRSEKEAEFMHKLTETENLHPGDVLLALQACWTIKGRAAGMEMLWRMNQSDQLRQYGLEPMSQEKIDWATDNGVDPRTLLISETAHKIAFELFAARTDIFLEPLDENKRNNIDLVYRLPGPGVIAKLMMTETGIDTGELDQNGQKKDPLYRYWGYVNIGSSPAINQTNTDPAYFPTSEQDLKWIANFCKTNIGIEYSADKIPGSTWREEYREKNEASGGAIGPQFMPINAKLFMKWFEYANSSLDMKYPHPNPFDPLTGTVMTYLYVASEFHAHHGEIQNGQAVTRVYKDDQFIRPGYLAGNETAMIAALRKWNNYTPQVNIAIQIGEDYYNKFWGTENDPRPAMMKALEN